MLRPLLLSLALIFVTQDPAAPLNPTPIPIPIPSPAPTPGPMANEQAALLALFRPGTQTHEVVASGAWNDPATWKDGTLPPAGARVLVPAGFDVSADEYGGPEYAALRIDGTLRIEPGSWVSVETVIVSGSGTLAIEGATRDRPIRLTGTDPGPIDRAADPLALSRGIVSLGRVLIGGEPVTPYVQAADQLRAGATSIRLASVPVNWRVGDRVVFPGTAPAQHEQRRLAAIDGQTITLDKGLTFNRLAPPTVDPSVSARERVHVANLERSVVLDTPATVAARRPHLMSMHSPDMTIENVAVVGWGRTDKSRPINDPATDPDGRLLPNTGSNPRARYSVHWHRAGHDRQGAISGSVVEGSPGWGIVNHSSDVNVSDCVVVGAFGASFVSEAGDESGSFRRNLAIGSTGSGAGMNSREDLQDFGHDGVGFWIQGPYPILAGNISAGHPSGAYIYWSKGLTFNGKEVAFPASALEPEHWPLAGGAETVTVKSLPARFAANTSYGCPTALQVFFVGIDELSPGNRAPVPFACDDLFSWGGQSGVYLAYGQGIAMRRATVVGSSGAGLAMDSSPLDVSVEGGYFDRLGVGIEMPDRGRGSVKGGTFNATTAVRVRPVVDQVRRPRSIAVEGLSGQAKVFLKMDFTNANRVLDPTQVRCKFEEDVVLFNGSRVRFAEQGPSFRPSPPWWPDEWAGLTNAEILRTYGVALGGSLSPTGPVPIPGVDGVADAAPLPASAPAVWASLIPAKQSGKVLAGQYVVRVDGVADATPTSLTPGRLHAIRREVGGVASTILVYAQ